jgi:hypothetical protein
MKGLATFKVSRISPATPNRSVKRFKILVDYSIHYDIFAGELEDSREVWRIPDEPLC